MPTIPTSGTYSSPQGTINNSNKTTISKVADKKNNDSDSENNSTTASAENKTVLPTAVTNALKENADLKLALDKANQYSATVKGELDKYQTQIQNLTGLNSQQQNSATQAAMSMMGMGGMGAMGGALGSMGNWGQSGAEKPSGKRKKRDEDDGEGGTQGQGLKDVDEKPPTNGKGSDDPIKPKEQEPTNPEKKTEEKK